MAPVVRPAGAASPGRAPWLGWPAADGPVAPVAPFAPFAPFAPAKVAEVTKLANVLTECDLWDVIVGFSIILDVSRVLRLGRTFYPRERFQHRQMWQFSQVDS